MPDLMACPKCGAQYARGGRAAGKVVVCACGQKFTVPTVETPREKTPATPPSSRAPGGTRWKQPQTPPSRPPRAQPGNGGGSAAASNRPAAYDPFELPLPAAGALSATPLPKLASAAKPRKQAKKTKKRKLSGADRIAGFVLFILLPVAAVCTVVGIIAYAQTGQIGPYRNRDRGAETGGQLPAP